MGGGEHAGEEGAGGGEEAGEVEAEALGGGADLGRKQFGEVNCEGCGHAGGEETHHRRGEHGVIKLFGEQERCRHGAAARRGSK